MIDWTPYREAMKKMLAEHDEWRASNPEAARFLDAVGTSHERVRIPLLPPIENRDPGDETDGEDE